MDEDYLGYGIKLYRDKYYLIGRRIDGELGKESLKYEIIQEIQSADEFYTAMELQIDLPTKDGIIWQDLALPSESLINDISVFIEKCDWDTEKDGIFVTKTDDSNALSGEMIITNTKYVDYPTTTHIVYDFTEPSPELYVVLNEGSWNEISWQELEWNTHSEKPVPEVLSILWGEIWPGFLNTPNT